jgi:hypothetical protein
MFSSSELILETGNVPVHRWKVEGINKLLQRTEVMGSGKQFRVLV